MGGIDAVVSALEGQSAPGGIAHTLLCKNNTMQ